MQALKYLHKILLFSLGLGGFFCAQAESPKRVVSLAPSLTEIVYAINAGNTLVGVSRYCDFPAEAKLLPKVGGLYDPNYEAIVALKPNLVLSLEEHRDTREKLSRLGIQSLAVSNKSSQNIISSIKTIGQALDKNTEAQKLINKLQDSLEQIASKITHSAKPKVLVVVGGHSGKETLSKVYVAGKSTFYEELIELAGGENVYREQSGYPIFTVEGLLKLNPDVIVDIVPDGEARNIPKEEIISLWKPLDKINAVKDSRVVALTEEFVVNPGPRFINTLHLFVKAIHPELSND